MPPLCGGVVTIVWLEPETHIKVCDVVYGVPSTVKERPAGFACTVTEIGLGVKLAVSVIGPFIVTDDELLFPKYEPLPLPVQLLKL